MIKKYLKLLILTVYSCFHVLFFGLILLNIIAIFISPLFSEELVENDIRILEKSCSDYNFSKASSFYADYFISGEIEYWITTKNNKGGLAASRRAIVPVFATLPYLSKLHIKDCNEWIIR